MKEQRMSTAVKHQLKVISMGARGCSSCTCDPCDCNPCTCGDDLVPPSWRVSGYYVHSGQTGSVDLAGLMILSLALPGVGEGRDWHEVILMPESATLEQVASLLALFKNELESIPAEVEASPVVQKPIYAVPMEYIGGGSKPFVHVTFAPEHATLLRAGAPDDWQPREWIYDGPLALRQRFDIRQ
jgi:hypothetical protein